MTTKLTIKSAVFRCDLTLVAKYAFLQALSHLEIRLVGSEGDSTTGTLCILLIKLSEDGLVVRKLLVLMLGEKHSRGTNCSPGHPTTKLKE